MREWLQDAADAAAGAGAGPLHHQRLADMCFRDDEIIHIQIVIVLRVRNGALQGFAYLTGNPLARELQVGERR
jgi:hypothetical protein